MTIVARAPDADKAIVGVDTHKYVHVAVAIDALGRRLGSRTVSADRSGYDELERWSATLAARVVFGIEGTGSYGAGLTSALRRAGRTVIEVNRGDRRARRGNGKSDTIDAELAARRALRAQPTAVRKTADGASEMLRQIKIARDTAVKARTQAIVALKCLIV